MTDEALTVIFVDGRTIAALFRNQAQAQDASVEFQMRIEFTGTVGS